MNKAYSLVWNEAQGGWCAVSETARRRGKTGSGKRLLAAGVLLLGLAATSAYALPTGGAVASGKADIATSADGKTMSINQHTDKLITNWQDFSVAGGERVSFQQPDVKSIALNRVIGTNGSQIHGQIDANGKVFVVNPNGVVFGAGAQVNVGGLVASTKNISDADFLAGNYRFSGTSGQSVENAGTIEAAEGGSVALLGARVSNTGVIRAKAGRVALGAGNAFTVNFDGNGLLNLQVEGGAMDAQAHNGGLLSAEGGEVLMTARAANGLLNAVVNNSGTIEAQGLKERNGKIVLDGGLVQVAGKLNAAGGDVTTRGEQVKVAVDTQVDTRSSSGRTGTWTIESANANVDNSNTNGTQRGLTIDGANSNVAHADAALDAATLSRALGTTNVALTNTSGDLTVNGAVNWASDHTLALTSQKGDVALKQAVAASGTKASVKADAAGEIRVDDKLALTGDHAHLELNAKKGHRFTQDNASATLSGRNASFSSNGEGYQVIHDVAGLRNVDRDLKGRYVLGNAIDGKGAAFRSIGARRAFEGVFDGLGNTIGDLSISNPGSNAVGLFEANGGRIANLGLDRISTRAVVPYGRTPASVGTLAGYNFGTISDVKATNVAVSSEGMAIVGGLVGSNYGGSIERASVLGFVNGGNDALHVGGLAGENISFVSPGADDALIRDSRADVQVVSASNGSAGGLVGDNHGVVDRSTATGIVNARGSGARVGGLVGVNNGGVINASTAAGDVRGARNASVGGLVGHNTGRVDASTFKGIVAATDGARVGGLVGENRGVVHASTAVGRVMGGASNVGGLVGANFASVRDSTASVNVDAGMAGVAGGLVGYNAGRIDASSTDSYVTAAASGIAGGLVGRNAATGEVLASSAAGDVIAGDFATAGGLAGVNDGAIHGSSSKGAVMAGMMAQAGGLVGVNAGTVQASASTGSVVSDFESVVGGLVASNSGVIDGSSASGDVRVGFGSIAGGLVGRNTGTVRDAGAKGTVAVTGTGKAGGLVGFNAGRVSSSSASGDVLADRGSSVGGLIGENAIGASVEHSSATGSAAGGHDSYVGGLVGFNSGMVASSSAAGTVSGGYYARLGGLAGANFGTFDNATTATRVALTPGYRQQAGAFAALNFGLFKGSSATGAAAGMPLANLNYGQIRD
ncbi:filamentous hemagglutinin family N-terminal domain protein [Burkholderia cepacia]|uniref:two-partner secretion domain-containing protein n=1 Tax=Burkholderia cepacia TaxID=292 RepID=UPI002990190A|nr:GLUG motif-containing protein [Burkholderia cepacia]MDW9227361.1 filamentous hemagglutinin family N-terminal domain protein [Burkholderia cepacia]